MSSVEAIISRIMLACSRSLGGGDMFFFVDDLFGGGDVVLKPAAAVNGDLSCIEINVKAGRIEVITRAFWEVWGLDDLGKEGAAPLLKVGGKMTEVVELRLERGHGGGEEDGGEVKLELRERLGEERGRRTLKIIVLQ